MSDPYRMVLITLTSSALLFFGLLIYKFVYPKKKINLLVALSLISLLQIINMFRPGAYESGDFNIHIYRIISFYNSLSEGNIIPSWAAELNGSFGYPLFIFNYQLPYYAISLFHFLGISFINSMKIYLAITLLISGMGMYIFVNKTMKNSLAAFTAGIIYLFNPYHLVSLHFKVGLGETTIFALLPFAFFSIFQFQKTKKILNLILISLLIFLLFESHAAMAVFSLIILFCYSLFLMAKTKSFQLIKYYFVAFFLGLILPSYLILAPFVFKDFVITSKYFPGTVAFPTLSDLLYSPWMYSFLFQGHKGEISNTLGYAALLIIFLSLFLLFKKKVKKKFLKSFLFWSLSCLLLLFFVTEFSKPIWEKAYFLAPIGSHRLLILFSFAISIIGAILSFHINKKLIIVILFIAVSTTFLNWGHRKVINGINDQTLRKELARSTANGEGHFYANSKWVKDASTWFKDAPDNHLEILKGQGEIKELKKSTTSHLYQLNAKTELSLQENTLYFPGWKGFANNKEVSLSPDSKGRISLTLPPGKHSLLLQYKDIPLYNLLKYLSFLFLGIVLGVLLFLLTPSFKKIRNRKLE